MSRSRTRTVLAALVGLALALPLTISGASLLLGCPHKADPVTGDVTGSIVVKQDTEGLLLTWIDEKGDFHVEQKPSDVPMIGRDAVRVVDPTREEGTHSNKVFVADMRVAQADGAFPVHVMTRAEFDQLAVARRQKQGVATLPSAAASGDLPIVPLQQSNPLANATPQGNSRPQVVIYGASWCGACHDAAAYLRQRGVSYVEKDVESDADAAREMKSKLSKNGLRGGSIPVLDVRGRVMVGFNAQQVDEALGKAL